jgi:hypothetical protein
LRANIDVCATILLKITAKRDELQERLAAAVAKQVPDDAAR